MVRKAKRPSRLQKTKAFISRLLKPWWAKVIAVLISLVILWFGAGWAGDTFFPVRHDYNFGTSFSIKRAEGFGLDWKTNFTALLDDLKIRKFRLMSYWDTGEPTPGNYNFGDLDWQISEAAKRGAKVTLSIGLRQPRWPECFQPDWATRLIKSARDQALLNYIRTVINRYENNSTVESWQLENEAYNTWFGICGPVDDERIHREFDMVKSISHKPLTMSLGDQYGLPIRQPTADAFGYSVYRIVYDRSGPGFYVNLSTPLWYHKLRAFVLTAIWHKPLFIHELQLEPWGPADIRRMPISEQDKSMSVEQVHSNIRFARQIGFDDVYTWGSEWWYWRKEKLHDPSIWNAVQQEINDSKK